MKFYNREDEIVQLQQISKNLIDTKAIMSIVVGRRRIGKTRLLIETFKNRKIKTKFIYLFISKKAEKLLCSEFLLEIKNVFNIPIIGKIETLTDIFDLLVQISKKESITLVIDEFQELQNINSSIFSSMQNIWDQNKKSANMHLILCGSIYSIMWRIFINSKEPLFGRADNIIHLHPLKSIYIHELLKDHNAYTNDNLLALYTITGGVPRYLELFANKLAFNLKDMIKIILEPNSIFLIEGKNILIEEFGKDFNLYFSILSLIASGKTSRPEIESILQKAIGTYLERLENEFNIIKKIKPILAKQNSRIQKYYIKDNFINFWFKFIFKNQSAIELGNTSYVKDIIIRDFKQYSGFYLEKIFCEHLALKNEYNIIGNYWEKGNINEIDIVAINEQKKLMLIAEVKYNQKKINISKLHQKAYTLIKKYPDYNIEFKGFSIVDLEKIY